jgi:hypothetical protein
MDSEGVGEGEEGEDREEDREEERKERKRERRGQKPLFHYVDQLPIDTLLSRR